MTHPFKALASLITLSLISVGCSNSTTEPDNNTYTGIENAFNQPVLFLEKPSIKELTPLEYLEKLNYTDGTPKDYFMYHNDSIPNNWVKEEHIPALVNELENTDLAHPVASIYASILTKSYGLSTIANEAYYLLLSYRTSNYPPYSTFKLGSSEDDTTKLSSEKKREMIEWYNSQDFSKHDFK